MTTPTDHDREHAFAELIGLGARLRGDLLQRFKLVPADQVHLGDETVGLGAEGGLGLLAR